MQNKKVLLIGAGNMGSAIGKALLAQHFIVPENLFVTDTWKNNLDYFADKNCITSVNTEELLSKADIVVLATKPQVLRELLLTWKMKELFKHDVILISIAAGISVKTIQDSSGVTTVVRVMPNMPLLVEKGVSGYFVSDELQNQTDDVLYVKKMMNCFGLAVSCETEEKINAITALSGSGPAYFFRLLESMQEQGEKFGFTQTESEQIALHTLLGAGLLAEKALQNKTDTFTSLREKVTSKGGTTAAALDSFEKNNLSEIFQKGMHAAKNRAEEL
ncbi:TPA: pyrroline-5-carboxylate reductase [Candidatus Gracilibacteria bacterium]|nr:pyrroline-5-carboxylate reductase [Candidatus Peregrinibacteria bacterium]HIQ56625.1 pyrroline-5-carboxylate reductase [Candidatus Gracilibacteria bacterium]HIQ57109.1 pyrroline-5-carboxylate reductase [Candidatus Gracilibacteria bacterium]